ncbi:hypothetical protein [Piscibacillus salipiscarius]|uniref:hypothetical protein n=1 Tax=Piscibacillus salipiscarius TaxID=299480 RepID=UPI0006D00B7A|nr:hypothetical protein [Piscibacillus salipiscarius]
MIGGRAGTSLKRKPSSIYWNGLRTFGFLKHQGLSLSHYARAVTSLNKDMELLKSLGNEEQDDSGFSNELSGTFWRCLLPPKDWKEHIDMDLTYEEALYLKQRIMTSPLSKDSLFSHLLQYDEEFVRQLEGFDWIGELTNLPSHIQEDYSLAERFNQFIKGANIRYNVLLSNGENHKSVDKWEQWLNSEFVLNEFGTFDYHQVLRRLGIHNMKLMRFLGNWKKAVASKKLEEIDSLIIKREIELKSRDRAKLNNTKNYVYKDENDWVGSENLHYRFNDAKNIMMDIFEGLKQEDA